MRFLLDNRVYPISSTVGFLERPLGEVVEFFASWQKSLGPLRRIKTKFFESELEAAFLKLEPLHERKSKYLLMATDSRWTAIFDDVYTGPDVTGDVIHATKTLGCNGVRVVVDPGFKESHYACILEVYGPQACNKPLNYVRTVTLADDGDRWVFHQSGKPYDFEKTEFYERSRKKDRFNFDLLSEYLGHFDIHAFEDGFYKSDKAAVVEIMEITGFLNRKYSLHEVQRRCGVSFTTAK